MNAMFCVALFLRSEKSLSYNLIPSDISILFLLASHIGERQEWYISHDQLSVESRLKNSQLKRRLKNLISQKLIEIRRTGKANSYKLTIPKLSTDSPSMTYHENSDRSSMDYQIGHRGTNRWVIEGLHKETKNKLNKPESARTRRTPLSPSFFPNKKNLELAHQVANKTNLTTDQLLSKFINLQLSKENTSAYWDGEYENFLLNERPVGLLMQKPYLAHTNEVKSTVQEWGKGHPAWDELHGKR